ncbi:hypothetical protein SAMN05444487_10956 [Marininema mesophilum]|uniref:Uncharacterized protein n=1 Tax=Marininema mesophilum TaxID=1048340 RepID=A0A1H2YFL9_9BACL|nr:hypothetical protein [Marininema mesophilum]SDX03880.1 hypothetical protein SAMN05444487_10956 [Marininema mesophilum]
MNEETPFKLLRVNDFHTSLLFYRDKIGFTMERYDVERETVLFSTPGDRLIVTANRELDVEAFVNENRPQPFGGSFQEDQEETRSEEVELFQQTPPDEHNKGETQSEEATPEVESEPKEEQAETETQLEKELDEKMYTEDLIGEITEDSPNGPAEEATISEKSPQIEEVSRGERMVFPGENLLFHQERLTHLGVIDLYLEEYPGVEQLLILKDPDGYEIAFCEDRRLDQEELFSLYEKGVDLLDGVIIGMTEEELDRVTREGTTIRHTILQLVDFDMEMAQRIKWALAEPGRSYPLPLYEVEEWAQALDYASRPIHGEVAMLRLLREHILTLCDRIPDALTRHLVSEHGKVEVRTMMQVAAETAREQVQSILDTRPFHAN